MVGPYRIYFYSHEPDEPPHVHVDSDDQSAKFWLDPVALARNLGFGPASASPQAGGGESHFFVGEME
jgi:hypothetical protein